MKSLKFTLLWSIYLATATKEHGSTTCLTVLNENLTSELVESLSVPAQLDLLPLATMPDQTINTDEHRIPDRIVQGVLSASLEPRKGTLIEDNLEPIPAVLCSSKENANNFSAIKDDNEFFDDGSEPLDKLENFGITPMTQLERPTITLAAAEKLQHDAAIEQKDDDIDEINAKLDLTPTKIPSGVERFISTDMKVNNQTHSLLVPKKKDDAENFLIEKKEKPAIVTIEQNDSDRKSKFINKKKKSMSHSFVENDPKPTIIDKSASINEQTTSEITSNISTITTAKVIMLVDQTVQEMTSLESEKLKLTEENDIGDSKNIYSKKKNERSIAQKCTSIESLNQKGNDRNQSLNKLSATQNGSSPIETMKISSPSEVTTDAEQQSTGPKFSLRLKPTNVVNENDKLELQVHFVGQPKPKVTLPFHIFILLYDYLLL